MTRVQRLAPDAGQVELEPLLGQLRDAPALEPFGALAVDACDAVARALFADPASRASAELVALASWLRRSSLSRLAAEARASGIRVPRGLVLHVPPANVDAIAMYSLALSILAGNRNVVRLSSRAGAAAGRICAALAAVLAQPRFAALRAGTAVLAWERESPATALCSAACDARVLWGGDASVQAVRALPAGPATRDVCFVDRFSIAAIAARAWRRAEEPARDELARRLYNDAYWYDQRGCSSPRLVVWCGDREDAAAAGSDLFARLAAEVAAHGYRLPLAAVTAKLAWIAGAVIDRPVTEVSHWGNELSVLTLAGLEQLDRRHPGTGIFLQATVPALAELAAHVTPRDQTLAVYGFPRSELEAFARASAGRGIDRIVALGESLRFEHRWDGVDLLRELSKEVTISPAAAGGSSLELAA